MLSPCRTIGVVFIEHVAADGSVIRSFDSEVVPADRKARVYFAETWLGTPQMLPAGEGHHRFTWNLRYLPPPTLESRYSIAAVPGIATPILPAGAYVLPGQYTVNLTAGGQTTSRVLLVELDPRVEVKQAELAALLGFQQKVQTLLTRVVALHDEIAAGNEEAQSSPVADIPAKVANALTELAIDLEHADLLPTSSQQKLLDYERQRFDQAANEWKGIR